MFEIFISNVGSEAETLFYKSLSFFIEAVVDNYK